MHSLPFFYCVEIAAGRENIALDEATAHHCLQVLRLKTGDRLQLTDGMGQVAEATITTALKKQCSVTITRTEKREPKNRKDTIAISLLKNTGRFEWFLEKAGEMGISEIIPLHCARTEKQQFRLPRMQQILVSAMLQSNQAYLPLLRPVTPFTEALSLTAGAQRMIAYTHQLAGEGEKPHLAAALASTAASRAVFIGPEGDFTDLEITAALAQGFTSVTLGNTRLRSETAGIMAAVLLSV